MSFNVFFLNDLNDIKQYIFLLFFYKIIKNKEEREWILSRGMLNMDCFL